MESQPSSGQARASAAEDALRRLEERLGRASEAAERLIAETAGSALAAAAARSGAERTESGGPPGGGEPHTSGGAPPGGGRQAPGQAPPSGWQTPVNEDERRLSDVEVVMQVVGALRDLVPPDLQRRLAEALRELLLAIRALIDWYLERSEERRARPSQVQDIPIL